MLKTRLTKNKVQKKVVKKRKLQAPTLIVSRSPAKEDEMVFTPLKIEGTKKTKAKKEKMNRKQFAKLLIEPNKLGESREKKISDNTKFVIKKNLLKMIDEAEKIRNDLGKKEGNNKAPKSSSQKRVPQPGLPGTQSENTKPKKIISKKKNASAILYPQESVPKQKPIQLSKSAPKAKPEKKAMTVKKGILEHIFANPELKPKSPEVKKKPAALETLLAKPKSSKEKPTTPRPRTVSGGKKRDIPNNSELKLPKIENKFDLVISQDSSDESLSKLRVKKTRGKKVKKTKTVSDSTKTILDATNQMQAFKARLTERINSKSANSKVNETLKNFPIIELKTEKPRQKLMYSN